MNFLTAIRIILYFGLTAMLLSQPLTIVTVLLAVFTTVMTIVIAMIDYKSQVSYDSTQSNLHELMATPDGRKRLDRLYIIQEGGMPREIA